MNKAPKGMYVPIITPFREDQSIDFEAFQKVIDYTIENGVDGMLITGSTGEYHTMTLEEQKEVIKRGCEFVAGRVPVIAGVGKSTAKATIELANFAADCGAEPTLEHSAQLMAECDLVLATGAFGLTKAAYSSGTPAYGVGPGNPPVVLDRGYDLTDAVKMTITAVGSDNGILCDGDNMLLHPAEEEKALFDTMRQEGVVVFDKPEDVDKFREVLFVNGKSNPALVGKDATVIAKAAGFDIPESTKVIALKVSAVGSADILNKEIMGPVVVTKGYDTFEEAVSMAIQNMTESGGIGHTAGIFSNDEEHIRYYSERIPVARVLVNQPTPDAWGPATNSLSPAVSEGCGSWGNNILAGNVDYIHLINVSKAVMPLKVELPDGDKLFAD